LASTPNPIHSWFLGPKAENDLLLKELIDFAFESHVDWRRSYHPEDQSPIPASTQRSVAAISQRADLRREFTGLLQRLRESVPYFHRRYNADMVSETAVAAQAAYFAAMLQNQNNASSDAAPVTTALETEVAEQLARMIGYDTSRSWGHITSGGTIANMEALWIARNALYHPVAAMLATRALGVEVSVMLPDNSRAPLSRLDSWQLLNLRPAASLELWDKLWNAASGPVVESALRAYSLPTFGYQDYSRHLFREFGDQVRPAVVLAPGTTHCSWKKVVSALGIGTNQLVMIPVTAEGRMDPDGLWQQLVMLAKKRIPVMACVSTCGTAGQGAIDDLQQIVEVRARAEAELGVSFHIHSDATYGGYAASLTRAPDGSRQTAVTVREQCGLGLWPSDDWMISVFALASADSVSIDPHKLGYAPYPAGALLLRDKRARQLASVNSPFQNGHAGECESVGANLILETSKPGAAAAATWLSHRTMPLHCAGNGRLIASTMRAARNLHALLGTTDFAPFKMVRLPEPDLNIVCFFLQHSSLTNLPALNQLNEHIHRELSPAAGMSAPYMISWMRLTSPNYDGVVNPLLASLGNEGTVHKRQMVEGLVVLRVALMNPFSEDEEGDHLPGLVSAVRAAAMKFVP
jgi:glutamate/tyrosine decarboxylase-like PLP-dependent enzyme